VDVELRAVKSSPARIDLVVEPRALDRARQGRFRRFPFGGIADRLRRARAQRKRERAEVEPREEFENEAYCGGDLAFEIFAPAEDVGVVLREAAHTKKTRQDAAPLVAIDRPELREPKRELTVGAGSRGEDLHVERAVHRLHEVALVVGLDWREHGIPVEIEVPARLPEYAPTHVRRVHQLISASDLLLPPVVLEKMPDEGPLRMPEREPRTDGVVERKELELAPEPPVVARRLEAVRFLMRHGNPPMRSCAGT
jgi:hypothetical protein